MNDSLPIGWRSDAPLIKYFEHRYGPKMARAWQLQPLVDLRYEQERFAESLPTLPQRVPSITHRPFKQFVMDCGIRRDDTRAWAHVMSLADLPSISSNVYPWKNELLQRFGQFITKGQGVERYSLALIWAMADSKVIDAGVGTVIDNENWSDVTRGSGFEGRSGGDVMYFSIAARIAYLCSPPDRFVLVTPKGVMKERADRKVWTNGAPSIRILNLHTLKISRPSGIGTHASPRPHLRRGGTVTYLHPRWYSNWNAGDGIPLAAPLNVAEVAYRRENFLSGLDASGHPVISKKIGSHWYSLDVRQNERCSAEILASIDGAEIDGAIYKVLER